MKKIKLNICLAIVTCLLLSAGSFSQTLSPKVTPACGGYFTGGGNSLSWTMGETFTATLSSVNNKLTQGFQQPEISVYLVNAKALIEGFYDGNGLMRPVINPLSQPLLTDTIDLRLARNVSPFDILFSATSVLQTDGNVKFDFPISTSGNSYYLVMKHRNAVETWSAATVTINYNLKYDFTTAASKAYGNNMTETFDHMGWAFYSGDINQDRAIDGSDFLELVPSIQNGDGGYLVGDLNGDGAVDGSDFLVLDPNIQGGKGAITP